MRRSLSQSPGRVFYGWWIVTIGCVQDSVKGGLFNTGFTLYFLPVLTELNLSRAATSLPFSLSRLEAALGAPLVGYLIDRFDVRVMLVVGTLLAGLGLILLSLTHSYLLFLLVFIGPLSFGFQAGFNQATLAAVNSWFRRKRGLAMAIVQTGQAIGGVVIFPLVALAVLNLGWRTAAVLSGLVVFMLLPLVLLIRRSPESMGLLPDGERSSPTDSDRAAGGLAPALRDEREFTTREALRTPTFWLLAAFHGLRNIPYAGVTVHLVPLLIWKGLDEPAAAFYVGLTALATVVIRPLTGWLGDRQSKQTIGAVGVLLGAAGLAVLAYGDGAWWALVLFAVLFSFGDGVNSVTWALVGDAFGRAHFATIRGWISMFQSFASMPAAVYTGWVYDRTQSYTQALIAFVICYGAAAFVIWLIPHPTRPARLEVAASQALGVS
jgi:MFS family permease